MKQLVSKATTDTQLSKLRLATDDLVASMENCHRSAARAGQTESAAGRAGTAPVADALPETPAVAQQRNTLNSSKSSWMTR